MDLDLSIRALKKQRAMAITSGKFSSKEMQAIQQAIDILEIIQIEEKKAEYEDKGHGGSF